MTDRRALSDDGLDDIVRGIARAAIVEREAQISALEINTALLGVRSRGTEAAGATGTRHRGLSVLAAVAAVGLIVAGVAIVVRRDDTNSITPVSEVSTSGPAQPSVVTAPETATSHTGAVTTSTTPSPAMGVLVEPSVVASIAVPGGRMSIAASGGRVWVASQRAPLDGTPRTIVGIDPDTNAVVATIEDDLVGVNALTDAFGSLWACAANGLLRIDPSAAVIVARFPVGCSGGMAAGFDSLWLVEGHSVTRFDPGTGTSLATIPLDATSGDWGIAAGADALWVSNGQGPGLVSRIDPAANTVAATIPVPFRTRNVHADESGVWMSAQPGSWIIGTATSAVRIDPVTNKISGLYNDGIDGIGLDKAGPYLWVAGWGGPVVVVDTRTDQTVLTSNTLKPRGVTLGGERLLWAFGSIWVTEQSPGMVARIDPGSFATAATPIPAPPEPAQTCRQAPAEFVTTLYALRIVDLPAPACADARGVTPAATSGTCWHVCPDGSDIHGREIGPVSPPTVTPDGHTSWTVFVRVNYLSKDESFVLAIERITLTADGEGPLTVTDWVTIPTNRVLLIGANAIQQYLDALARRNYTEAAALLAGPNFKPDTRADLAPLGVIDPPTVDGLAVALRHWCENVTGCANATITGTQPSIDGTSAEAFVTFHDATTGIDTNITLQGGTNNQPYVTGLPPTDRPN